MAYDVTKMVDIRQEIYVVFVYEKYTMKLYLSGLLLTMIIDLSMQKAFVSAIIDVYRLTGVVGETQLPPSPILHLF